jgi:hypothetical protein
MIGRPVVEFPLETHQPKSLHGSLLRQAAPRVTGGSVEFVSSVLWLGLLASVSSTEGVLSGRPAGDKKTHNDHSARSGGADPDKTPAA